MGTKISKTNDERIDLSLNPKHKKKNTKVKTKNMNCVRAKYNQIFIIMK
jgi:hypothetical protein